MTKEEYMKTQMAIIHVGKTVSTLDLEGFLDQISNAQTVAPILDPTLYMKAQNNLEAIKNLVRSLLPVKKAHDEVFKAVLQTAARGDMQKKKEEIETLSDS